MATRTVEYRCRRPECDGEVVEAIPREQRAPDARPCPACRLDARRVWGAPAIKSVPGFYSHDVRRGR